MSQKEMDKRSYELLRIIEPYMVWAFDLNANFNYYLSEDAPPEVVEADEEYRSFVKNIEPIR